MKINSIYFIIVVASALLAACQREDVPAQVTKYNSLYAKVENVVSTKTVMDESRNIRWSENDQVVAFMKSSLGLKYQIQREYVGKTSGYFYKVSSGTSDYIGGGIEWDHNVVYYPYSDVVEAQISDDNYILDVDLPVGQTYSSGSFGNGTLPMVAVSEDNDMIFRNICGGIKLQFLGTQKISSIVVEGSAGEKLSGGARVTAYTDGTAPRIEMSQDAHTSVILDCGPEGVQLNGRIPTDFIISLPTVNFSRGFVVRVLDTDGNEYTVESDEYNVVLRSSLLVMPPVKLGNSEEKVSVRFSLMVASEATTKAISDAEFVDVVYYEVWNSDWSTKLYPADNGTLAKEVVVDGTSVVEFALAPDRAYNVIFWAQNEQCGAYDVTDLRRVKVNYSAMSAAGEQDKFDAFYAVANFTVYDPIEQTIHLKRPLAQLNFGLGETQEGPTSIKRTSITISNLATVFNTLVGSGDVIADAPVTFVADGPVSSVETLNVSGNKYLWLTMNYLFVSEDSPLVDIETCFEIDGRENPMMDKITNVPLKMNYRTSILWARSAYYEVVLDFVYNNSNEYTAFSE